MERVAKCRLNGTKKPPKRKARPNTTKYGPNAKLPKKEQKSSLRMKLANLLRMKVANLQ